MAVTYLLVTRTLPRNLPSKERKKELDSKHSFKRTDMIKFETIVKTYLDALQTMNCHLDDTR